MDPLTLAIVKCIATTCLKLYLGSMFGSEKLVYDKAELGYKVPSWYMQPARGQTFYAFGTSTEGDEFESLAAAQQQAATEMTRHIRLSNQKIAKEHIRYDRSNVKQQRLVDLFVRGDGLEDFISANAAVDKKQLVKVKTRGEMRAFVRLALDAEPYIEYQETSLQGLKSNLMRQKTEDILDEMSHEIENFDRSGYTTEEPEESPAQAEGPATPPKGDLEHGIPASGGPVSRTADGVFNELDQETQK